MGQWPTIPGSEIEKVERRIIKEQAKQEFKDSILFQEVNFSDTEGSVEVIEELKRFFPL